MAALYKDGDIAIIDGKECAFVPMWKLEKDRVPVCAILDKFKIGYWIPLDCNEEKEEKPTIVSKEPSQRTVTVPKNVDTTKPLPKPPSKTNDGDSDDDSDSSEKVNYTPSNKKRYISQKELFSLINGDKDDKSEEKVANKSDTNKGVSVNKNSEVDNITDYKKDKPNTFKGMYGEAPIRYVSMDDINNSPSNRELKNENKN